MDRGVRYCEFHIIKLFYLVKYLTSLFDVCFHSQMLLDASYLLC